MPQRKPSLRERLLHVAFRIVRPVTLGVKAMVLRDNDSEVYLVRHTYVPGWRLPGGGVEPGDSVMKTLHKELSEECNITLTGKPVFIGVFHNTFATKRDHIMLYVCRDFTQSAPKVPDWEIAEAGFFPVDALPEGTVGSARARIRDVLEGRDPPESWQAP